MSNNHIQIEDSSEGVRVLDQQYYQQRLVVEKLQQEFFQLKDNSTSQDLFNELHQAEIRLAELEEMIKSSKDQSIQSGLLLNLETTGDPGMVLGLETTGLRAQVHLRLAQVPTAIYHLFNPQRNPLVRITVKNGPQDIRRLRVTSYIEGFSAKAVDTLEIEADGEELFDQLPTLFRKRIADLTELERASLNVMVEDLDTQKVELHASRSIWLLARTTAPLAVRDPMTGEWQDLTPYLGAFVTPNSPSLMKFLRQAAEIHPEKRLVGYQGDENDVEPQVKALYQSLKQNAEITYINSRISFTPEQGAANQRVRLPRESLGDKSANCIDGAVLFASLLEAISLSPALVIVPGHAFVAWETWKDAPDKWRYLETTMIGSHPFEESLRAGEVNAARYQALGDATGQTSSFQVLPLRQLRTIHGILPME